MSNYNTAENGMVKGMLLTVKDMQWCFFWWALSRIWIDSRITMTQLANGMCLFFIFVFHQSAVDLWTLTYETPHLAFLIYYSYGKKKNPIKTLLPAQFGLRLLDRKRRFIRVSYHSWVNLVKENKYNTWSHHFLNK
jgi:hypothetical protein